MSAPKKIKTSDTGSRPYQGEWFEKYGVVECDETTICLICSKKVTSRTYNIRRHFLKLHSNLEFSTDEERRIYFSQKKTEYHLQSTSSETYPKHNVTAASFQVAHCVARHGKPLSEGEFVKQALLECGASLFADFEEKDRILQRISELPLSRNTIKDRVIELERDISKQLQKDLNQATMYSIALDESNDVNGYAQLAVFGRYKSGAIIKEELIRLITLKGKCTGFDIFKEFNFAFQEMGIDIEKIVSVTTDGAPNMVGKNIGFIQCLKEKISHPLIEFHCLIHQQVLCAKQSLKIFSKVMEVVVKVINFINARSLNKRQFANLLEEIESQYSGILTYNNVRWLSCGQVLNRFVSLLEEIKLFLNEKNNSFVELTNVNWLNDLMFFCDITQHFNELNKKLQGKGQIVLTMFENIKIFLRKMDIFICDLERKNFKYFPHLQEHFKNTIIFENTPSVQEAEIQKYLIILQEIKQSFEDRFEQFKNLQNTFEFLLYPTSAKFERLQLTEFVWLGIDSLEMELIEFQNIIVWKQKFENLIKTVEGKMSSSRENDNDPLVEIENLVLNAWDSLPDNFSSMKKLANALLTMFGSTYSCEKLFSSMNFIKSTQRNKLGNEMAAKCVKLMNTGYQPDIIKLSDSKQQQISH